MKKPPRKLRGEFQVGYRRPPVQTQFKPGQSGNPKGRPKGQPTAAEVFMREASRLVRVQKGDRIETISKFEGVVRKLYQKALEGDLGAVRLVVGMLTQSAGTETDGHAEEASAQSFVADLPDDDQLRRILARFDHLRCGDGGGGE